MQKAPRVFLFSAAAVFLAGCEGTGMFAQQQPVTSTRVIANDDEALFTAVTIETDRRILIIDEKDQTVCGEPSPDALESYSKQFADSIAESVRKGQVGNDAATSLVSTFDNAADNMTPLSQGIRFNRDQLYFLCLSRQNGYIDNDQYLALFQDIVSQSARLVALEVPTLRNSNLDELAHTRDFLKMSMETSEELAEALSDTEERRRVREEAEDDE